MAQVLVDEKNLEDIADSIRSKTDSEETYNPSEMAIEIGNIFLIYNFIFNIFNLLATANLVNIKSFIGIINIIGISNLLNITSLIEINIILLFF